MSDLLQLYTDDEREEFNEDALRECALIAELIHEGFIPRTQLVALGEYLSAERPYLVTSALEAIRE
jgi:hypothetical protein